MLMKEIRRELEELAVELDCPRLAELAEATKRRQRAVRTPARSTTMTDALRDQIKAYKAENPLASQAKIGALFKVSPGRVSETLSGKRT